MWGSLVESGERRPAVEFAPMDLELTGRRAVVTGGSRGIGKAIARALAAEGCDVGLVARDAAATEATAVELADESGRRVVALPADTGADAVLGQSAECLDYRRRYRRRRRRPRAHLLLTRIETGATSAARVPSGVTAAA
jgi:NAD(P)-dependent dehydrogenase (short-subunit alcohol dehydrogenase family)